jgi:hypothetical protein
LDPGRTISPLGTKAYKLADVKARGAENKTSANRVFKDNIERNYFYSLILRPMCFGCGENI